MASQRLFEGDIEGYKYRRHFYSGNNFYTNPYVTCKACNTVSFVDVLAIRLSVFSTLVDIQDRLLFLPPCRSCKNIASFEVGAHDFAREIYDRERLKRIQKEREFKAALLIQSSYRLYLRRMYGHIGYLSRMLRNRLHYRAATRITSAARGRLGRRRLKTEKYLLLIKSAHRCLLEFALKSRPNQNRVFWYARKLELEYVFKDYIEFCERLGFQPNRMAMEANFEELANRIMERKNDLLSKVQKIWRGFVARRTVKWFRHEVARLRQYTWSKVLKLQRLYRGFAGRLQAAKVRAVRFLQSAAAEYRNSRTRQVDLTLRRSMSQKILTYYRRERAEELVARVTSRFGSAADYGGRKMEVFSGSCFADPRLPKLMTSIVRDQEALLRDEKSAEEAEKLRKLKLLARVDNPGPSSFGDRGKPKSVAHPGRRLSNTFWVDDPDRQSSRASGMRRYLAHQLDEITEKVVYGVISKSPHGKLLTRFQDFNRRCRAREDSDRPKAKAEFVAGAVLKKFPHFQRYKYPAAVYDNPMKALDDHDSS